MKARTVGPAWLLPTVVFLGLAGSLYLPDILLARPQGLHFIRQTDVLSIVTGYHRFGRAFWEPAILDLHEAPDNGAAAGEFPVLYFLAAILDQRFGEHHGYLRIMNLFLVVGGHVLLAMAAGRWLGSRLRGLLFSVWMFSSGVTIYYACNYLPDAGAYGSVLMGWSAYWLDRNGRSRGRIIMTVAFFTLSGLLKVTMTMHLIALLALLMFIEEGRNDTTNSRRKVAGLIAGGVGILIVASWQVYAIRYNSAHSSSYFLTWAEPIWRMDDRAVDRTWSMVMGQWWPAYHYPSTWHVLLGLALLLPFLGRSVDRRLLGATVLLTMAGIAFVLLFFNKLGDHDYYFLTISPTLILIALASLTALLKRYPTRGVPMMMTIGLFSIAALGLNYGRMVLDRRYAGTPDRFSHAAAMVADVSEPQLQGWGIGVNDKVIVIGDGSPNGVLLHLGRRGWSFTTGDEPDREEVHRALHEAALALCIECSGPPTWLGGEVLDRTAKRTIIRLTPPAAR